LREQIPSHISSANDRYEREGHGKMTLTDDQLLDFDPSTVSDFEPAKAERALAEQGDAFRPQLVAARWIDFWREAVERDHKLMHSEEWFAGFELALRDIAAHLRQGAFLPGGANYEDEQGRG
jgi:hypothetical protein